MHDTRFECFGFTTTQPTNKKRNALPCREAFHLGDRRYAIFDMPIDTKTVSHKIALLQSDGGLGFPHGVGKRVLCQAPFG